LNTPKNSLFVCLLLSCSYSSSKLICRASGGVPITLSIVF
jgi:hypothetical protein